MTRNPLSKKITEIKPSGIRKFFDIVSEMKDAISLGVGEPDFDTPWHVRDEGIYSMEKGNASIQLYDIFPGVQLMVTDFQSDTCYQSCMEQDVISIEHCLKGRFECMFDNRN